MKRLKNRILMIGHDARRLHRWSIFSSAAVAALLALVSSGNFADLAGAERPAPTISVDAEWEALKVASEPRRVEIPRSSSREVVETARVQLIDQYLDQADRLRAFRVANTDHPQRAEAKRLEAFVLYYAAWAGDASRKQRREQLLEEVRSDESLPAALRAELCACAENLDVTRGEFDSHEERLAAFEAVARRLAEEFPEVAEVYEPLLQLARSQTDEEGRRIVDELLRLPAPEWIHLEAESMSLRYGLVGGSLAEIAGIELHGLLGATANPGRPLLIYTWSVVSEGTYATALRVAEHAPEEVVIVGVNLDAGEALDEARDLAGRLALPGTQLYPGDEGHADVVERLVLSTTPLVYAVSGAGIIGTVSGHRDVRGSIQEFLSK